MNDSVVHALWESLNSAHSNILILEERLMKVEARIRALLKEEADARNLG